MDNRRLLVFLIVCNIILATLGFIGLLVGGNFGDFIDGMTPGVLLGISVLMVVLMGQSKSGHTPE